MKYINSFICLIMILSCFSCRNIGLRNTAKKDTIFVSYIPGFVEFSVHHSCEKMKRKADKACVSKTIRLSEKDFEYIKDFLVNHKKKSSKNCGSTFYIKMDTIEICMNYSVLCGCYVDETEIGIDHWTRYFIKWKSDYYNHFLRTDLLEFDPEIEIYGIPNNYKYLYEGEKDDGYVRLAPVKVALIK